MSETIKLDLSEQSTQMLKNQLFLLTENEIKPVVQAAMGKEFFRIVRNNLGEGGEDRPFWVEPMLSPAYARKVGRPHATLLETGALRDAVELDATRPEGAVVSVSDNTLPYATVHQYGGGNNIPPRPYFPLDDSGNVMPYTHAKCLEAGEAALKKVL